MKQDDIFDLLESIEEPTRDGSYRKRGKFKVKYANIKRNEMFDIMSANTGIDREHLQKAFECFELFIQDLQRRALEEKISFKIPFLDDKLKVDYYESREVRNPAENTTFIAEPKVQVKFLNKRKDKV